jgi:hypothetical protein
MGAPTSAWTSSRSDRVPSRVAVTALPATFARRSERSAAEALAISSRPDAVIS